MIRISVVLDFPITVASKSPITKATRYDDIFIESANLVRTLLFSISSSSTTISLLTLKYFLSAIIVIQNTALKSGSSQQGKADRAAVGSNCVVAIHFFSPSCDA